MTTSDAFRTAAHAVVRLWFFGLAGAVLAHGCGCVRTGQVCVGVSRPAAESAPAWASVCADVEAR